MFQSPMLRSQSSIRLPYCVGVHSIVWLDVEHPLAHALDGDEPVVGDAEDQRRVAAPAVRIGVRDRLGLDEQPALAQVVDDPILRARSWTAPRASRTRGRSARPRRRASARPAQLAPELEVVAPRARRDVDDARALPRRRSSTGSPDGRPARRARARRTAPGSASRPVSLPSRVSANASSGAVKRRRPSRRPAAGRTRCPAGRRRRRSPAASTASSSRRRAPRPGDRAAAGEPTATGAHAPGRRRPVSARAATATFRSAGTTPTSDGRETASRARRPPEEAPDVLDVRVART